MHAHVLAVHDLSASAEYFIEVLGFEREWAQGGWQGLIRDGVRVMLGECPDAASPSELGDHGYFGFFSTDGIDELHQQFALANARIISPPSDKPWGWREMAVATPEGHRMMFAQWIGDARS
jgi:uncharacterized glyoxalase superfamily protein PhnB